MPINTLNVNLFAGPGSGKSTTAAAVFARLKKAGVNCELVTEFAKDKVWEGNSKIFLDQCYIFGKQHWKMSRLQREVDVVITDSPLLLSLVYNDKYESLPALALEAHRGMDSLNFFLNRTKPYNPKGRHQDEDGARALDSKILDMLITHDVDFVAVPGNEAGEDWVFDKVMEALEAQRPKDGQVLTSFGSNVAWADAPKPDLYSILKNLYEKLNDPEVQGRLREGFSKAGLVWPEAPVAVSQTRALTPIHSLFQEAPVALLPGLTTTEYSDGTREVTRPGSGFQWPHQAPEPRRFTTNLGPAPAPVPLYGVDREELIKDFLAVLEGFHGQPMSPDTMSRIKAELGALLAGRGATRGLMAQDHPDLTEPLTGHDWEISHVGHNIIVRFNGDVWPTMGEGNLIWHVALSF